MTLKKAGGPDKGEKFTVKMVEMAQVVPRGRVMVVLVGEKEVCFDPSVFFPSAILSSKRAKDFMQCCSCSQERQRGKGTSLLIFSNFLPSTSNPYSPPSPPPRFP